MPHRNLNKAACAIIARLGGAAEFGRWYGITTSHADHWRDGFPAYSYVDLSRRLKVEKRIVADVSAWNMRPKKRRSAPKTKRPQPKATARGAASASA